MHINNMSNGIENQCEDSNAPPQKYSGE